MIREGAHWGVFSWLFSLANLTPEIVLWLYYSRVCRFLVDVILSYEEDGNLIVFDYENGLQLQSYKQGKKQAGMGCCMGGSNEPSTPPGIR